MSNTRRTFIKKAFAASSYLLTTCCDLLKPANAQSILEEALANLIRDKKITDSDKITITIPKVAENGALVPIKVESTLSHVESIAILVEKNPIPLAAKFELSPELEPFVSAHLKMATASDVIVMVETNDAFYRAKEHVSVTIGGCGD